jgi:hypothetical protein
MTAPMRPGGEPRLHLLEGPPAIAGELAALLDLYGFRPSRPRPDTVWVRGRRSSGRRVAAILESDGTVILHRQSRRSAQESRVIELDRIGPELRRLLKA